jgi:hypothetical protein
MDPIRNIMTLIDEHKTELPENVYLEICRDLKRLYASGDTVRDNYILNLTNDYLALMEQNETLRKEITQMKRDLVRSRMARFEDVSVPISNTRSFLENLMGASTSSNTSSENSIDEVPLPPMVLRF